MSLPDDVGHDATPHFQASVSIWAVGCVERGQSVAAEVAVQETSQQEIQNLDFDTTRSPDALERLIGDRLPQASARSSASIISGHIGITKFQAFLRHRPPLFLPSYLGSPSLFLTSENLL